MADITALTLDQINNALDFAHESEDIEAAWEASMDDAWRDEMCCPYCGKRECQVTEPGLTPAEADRLHMENARLDLRQREVEFDDQIHEGYRIGALRRAFDKVSPRPNWKEEIVAGCHEHEIPVLKVAIPFFTGSVPSFQRLHGDVYAVRAIGYYRAVGA